MTDSPESRLKTVITVLPVLSAGLYVLGAMHYEGYLTAFGIEQSLFPVPFDRLLLGGFLELLVIGVVPITSGATALLFLLVAVLITALFSSVPRVQDWHADLVRWLERGRSKRAPSPKVDALLDKFSTFFVYGSGIFLVFVSLVVVASTSARSGKEQAEREIEDFAAGKGNYVYLTADQFQAPRRARQLLCGTTYCAFWLGKEAVILRHEQIKQIVTHNPSLK